MTEAALKAGRGLTGTRRRWKICKSGEGTGDYVSAADRKAEKILHDELARARPAMGRHGRKRPDRRHRQRPHWFIDPLDGTRNFLHGLPIFAIRSDLRAKADGRRSPSISGDRRYVIAEERQGATTTTAASRGGPPRPFRLLIGCGIPHLGKHKEHPRIQADLARLAKAGNLRRSAPRPRSLAMWPSEATTALGA